jgi:carboxyl-terminal processing protease
VKTWSRHLLAASLLMPLALHAQDPTSDSNIEAPVSTQPSTANTTKNSPERLPLEDLRIFADAFNQIRQSYVEDVDDRELLQNAIRGMLEGLDPHSAYLDEESLTELQESTTGEFAGLGLEVGMENGFLRVITPIDDTPASKAGVKAGDIIMQLNDKPTKGMTLDEAVNMMRGKKGSPIKLTIARENVPQPIELTLIRDIIKVVSVKHRILEPGYGYIRVAQFQSDTGNEFAKAVEKLKSSEKPLKGLVLDLRNNPGGVLQAAVAVVDTVLDGGLVVYTEGRVPNSQSRFAAQAGDALNGAPIVVLINGGSASASEIVAGALQDHKRAVVVGVDSFGKGSVQTILPLSETRALKLTTARYFTPHGRSIQAQGIKPDIIIEQAKLATVNGGPNISEADLNRHLRNNKDKDSENTTQRRKENLSDALRGEDSQLFDALNLLKGLSIYQNTIQARSNVIPPIAGENGEE